MGQCRDCKYWKTKNPSRGENYDRSQVVENGWWDGECKRIRDGLSIETYDDAPVKKVETEANFGCVLFE